MLENLHLKMLSQINAAHGFVCDDIGGCARREYAAVTDDIRMIANAERLAHIVIGHWNANIAPLQKADDFLDFQYRNRINPGKGSSSRMNLGFVASARAISTRRRSPPDNDSAMCSFKCAICNSFINAWVRAAMAFAGKGTPRASRCSSSTARIFCSTDNFRKTELSWGK